MGLFFCAVENARARRASLRDTRHRCVPQRTTKAITFAYATLFSTCALAQATVTDSPATARVAGSGRLEYGQPAQPWLPRPLNVFLIGTGIGDGAYVFERPDRVQ